MSGPWLSLDPPPRPEQYQGKHRADPDDLPDPPGAGADPYGRTKEDWERHAE